MFFKIDVLRNFAIFTGKQLCWSLFLIKLQVWRPISLLKRGFNTRVILWILQNFLRTAFLMEHFRWLLLKRMERTIEVESVCKFGNQWKRVIFENDLWRRFCFRKQSFREPLILTEYELNVSCYKIFFHILYFYDSEDVFHILFFWCFWRCKLEAM